MKIRAEKFVFVVIMGFDFFQWYSGDAASNYGAAAGDSGKHMIGLLTTVVTVRKMKEHNAEGILFAECFLEEYLAR